MSSRRSKEWKAWVENVRDTHKVGKKPTGKFKPEAGDAFKLAAIQWWAATLGRIAIEVYATDRRQYKRMSKILSDSAYALRSLSGQKKLFADGDACQVNSDCPEGFFCDEGTCAPIDAFDPNSI